MAANQELLDDIQSERGNTRERVETKRQEKPAQQSQGQQEVLTVPRSRMGELGVMALAFGIPMWWFAALNTMNGWVRGINIFIHHLGFGDVAIPSPAGYWTLVALLFGWFYSRSEITHFPWRRVAKSKSVPSGLLWSGFIATLSWLLVIGTDLGAQFLGITEATPELKPSAWPIEHWIATTFWAAGLWTVILTFVFDRMILWGARQLGIAWLFAKIGIK